MKNNYNRQEVKAGNILARIYNFMFYIYFVLSIMGFLFYFLKLFILFRIVVVVSLILYVVEVMMGIDKNVFGLSGITGFGIIGYLINKSVDSVFLWMLICIFIGNFIIILLSKLFSFLIRKLNK